MSPDFLSCKAYFQPEWQTERGEFFWDQPLFDSCLTFAQTHR